VSNHVESNNSEESRSVHEVFCKEDGFNSCQICCKRARIWVIDYIPRDEKTNDSLYTHDICARKNLLHVWVACVLAKQGPVMRGCRYA
jgi:hypothetical protein